MVFLLGLRHGMDPDHLATLDGLARHKRANPAAACTLVRVLLLPGAWRHRHAGRRVVAATLHDAAAPQWLERLGTWIPSRFSSRWES